jgi:uncharacterized membrane protein YdjX (TVP38/TMEM64 family)
MARTRRRLVWLLFVAVGLGVLAWVFGSQFTLVDIVRRERLLRGEIGERPWRAWFIGFVVYFLASLVPGTRGKAVAFGWLYGFWLALPLVNLALTCAAQAGFLASRYLLRGLVESRYGPALVRINRILQREGASYVILLRIFPVSFTLTNYLFGATAIHGGTFWWATQVGLLPGNIVFVFVGARLPSLEQVLERGLWSLWSWDLLLVLVVLSAFPLVVHRVVRWLRRPSPPAPGMPE